MVVFASSDDEDGFDEFYKVEYSRIVRLMFGLTGRWPLAEELAQESMLSAHRNGERVRTLDRPDLWLRRVALNRAISTHRRLVAELAALGRVRAPSVSELPLPADERIWSEIRRLSRKQPVAVVLWAVEGARPKNLTAKFTQPCYPQLIALKRKFFYECLFCARPTTTDSTKRCS